MGARLACALALAALVRAGDDAAATHRLVAHVYDSGFADAHDTYNGIGAASDGRGDAAKASPSFLTFGLSSTRRWTASPSTVCRALSAHLPLFRRAHFCHH